MSNSSVVFGAIARQACITVVLVAIGRRGAAAQSVSHGRENLEDTRAREEWFWSRRSYPSTVRPYAAMLRARSAALEMRSGSAASFSVAPALLGGSWRSIGPFGLLDASEGYYGSGAQLDIGRVAAVAPSPVAGGPLFIGTASAGVWRSATRGLSWAPLTDDQCALTIGAVALDPSNPLIIYAATGEGNVNSLGCGVLRSVDGGISWTSSNAGLAVVGGGFTPFGRLWIDRATAGSATSTVIVGASAIGAARSSNSGASWSITLTGAATSVVGHPTRNGVVFVGNSDYFTPTHRGLFRSLDAGESWTQFKLPVTDQTTIGRIELANTVADPDKVWVLVENPTTRKFVGLFRWDNVAQQFIQLDARGLYTGDRRGDFGAQGEYDLAIAVDPRDAKRIYIAGVRAFRSVDGGATFTPMGTEIHTDWHTIVIDPTNPDVLYAGTDGGVFVSTDAGDTWTSRNAGLAITQFYPGVSINPQGTVILGGTQDNGTSLFTGSPYWDGFDSGDGGFTAINYANPTIRYGESQWDTTGAHIVRQDATTFSARNSGIVSTDRAQFIPPLIIDPIKPTKLYFGTHRLYRTIDEGLNWVPISADLTKGSGTITTIAVAPTDSSTIYVGTHDGNIQVSRDYGLTFTVVSASLPNRTVTQIAVDPASSTHALATFSGFGTGHIYETADAGATWRNISGNLIDSPANASVFVGNPGNIFVGTDVGVFQTADDGVSWVIGPGGLPNVIVHDLVYSASANLLVAATYGRGMFAYAVGGNTAVLRGDVNADGKIDAFDALLVQQALVAIIAPGTVIYPRGDANCNGVIDSDDAVLILRAAVGLPTGAACVGTTQ